MSFVLVKPDPASGRCEVEGFGFAGVLRAWTWGERQRLLDAATTPTGELDAERFVTALVRLVIEPTVPDELAPLFAQAALERFGARARRDGAVMALVDAEILLARSFGWGPRELDQQPAPDVDRLVERLRATEAGAPRAEDDGWTVIRVEQDA